MAIIPFRHGCLCEPWENLDRFFDQWPEIKGAEFVPPLDIYEKKGKVVVETSVPGVDPEKIDISIENNILTIKGKSQKKSEVQEKDYYRKEVKYGSFYRQAALPTKVVKEKAQADYKDGMLIIEIPKATQVKGEKKINIKIKNKK